MGIYRKIIKRNKIEKKDQEYIICNCDDYNTKKNRFYDKSCKYMKESEIIEDIKNGKDYRTSENTKVKIGSRDGEEEYIYTEKNSEKGDNLTDISTY